MKKVAFLTFFILNISLLLAATLNENFFIGINKEHLKLSQNSTKQTDLNISFAIFKALDSSINIKNIAQKEHLLKPADKSFMFQDNNMTYWVKLQLGKNFPSGKYRCSYSGIRILQHTFSKKQQFKSFKLNGQLHFTFCYQKGVDKREYFFKIEPIKQPNKFSLLLTTENSFFINIKAIEKVNFFIAMIFGILLMAGIYNGVLYYYNRDLTYLYYAILQLLMLMYIGAEIFIWEITKDIDFINLYYSVLILVISLVVILFTFSFLEVKKYIFKLYYFFIGVAAFIVVDIVIIFITNQSIVIKYDMIGYLMLPLLIAGIIRVKQGYKPAYFFFLGWSALCISVFLHTYRIGIKYTIIDPALIGAVIEAIMFSLALSYKIRLIRLEQQKQNELLIHQNKLASMGEMLGNIAHQWRQPLTHLSLILMNLKEAYKYQELTKEYLDKKLDDANKQLQFMSETIDCFTEFYTPKKEKQKFYISEAIFESIEIMENTIARANIDLKVLTKNNFLLYTYKNELKQVLVNIILNSKDAFMQREIQNPKIVITTIKNSLIIEDNAGGINEDVIDKIFEPYFSTKVGSSGLGLYMSKTIIEHHLKAQLNVTNIKDGVRFEIIFNIDGVASWD